MKDLKNIKTFEQFSLENQEMIDEGLFDKVMQGGKKFKLDGKDLKGLLEKHKADFSVSTDNKVKGTKRGIAMYTAIKNHFTEMTEMQALEACLKIVDWNGFMAVDLEKSTWNKSTLEFECIKAASTRGSGFNVS